MGLSQLGVCNDEVCNHMTDNGVFHLSIKSPIWTETNPSLKGTVSPFPHPQFVPNLYEVISSDEHKRRYFVTK